jgi:hypothetical protein
VNQELFLKFPSFIRLNRGMGPIALVLDQYPAHMTLTSHAKAREPKTKFIPVPKRETACCQPLDHRIYGALKSKARAKSDCMTANENTPPVTKEAAAKLSQKCWKELTKENVFDAWQLWESPVTHEYGRQYLRTKQSRLIRRRMIKKALGLMWNSAMMTSTWPTF